MRGRWILETHHTRAVSEMLYRTCRHGYFWDAKASLPQAGRAAGCGTNRSRTAVVITLAMLMLLVRWRWARRGLVYSSCAVYAVGC